MTPFSTRPGCVGSLVALGGYFCVLNVAFLVSSSLVAYALPGPWQPTAWLWTTGLATVPLLVLAWQAGTRASARTLSARALHTYETSLAHLAAGAITRDELLSTLAITTQTQARQALAAADRLRRDANLSPGDEIHFQQLTRQFLDNLTSISTDSSERLDTVTNTYLATIARLVAR